MSWLLQLIQTNKIKFSILFSILVFIIFLPYIVQFWILNNIAKQGFEQASIDDVDVNIFQGEIVFKKVHLIHQGEEKLIIGLMRANYRWQGLFSGGLTTELLEIEDASLAVRQDEDGKLEVVFPIQQGNEITEVEPSTEPEDDSLKVPNLDVDLIRFSNVNVNISTPKFEGGLLIEEFKLTRASTWHDNPVQLLIAAKLNGNQINVNLQAEPLAATPTLEGNIEIEQFDLSSLSKLTPKDVAQLNGSFSTKLDFSGYRENKSTVHMSVNGEINIEQLQASYNPLNISIDKIQNLISSNLTLSDSKLSFDSSHNIDVKDVQIVDGKQQYSLLSIDSVQLNKLQLTDALTLSLDTLILEGFSAVENSGTNHSLLGSKRTLIKNVQFEPVLNSLDIEQIMLSSVQGLFNFDQQGSLINTVQLNNTVNDLQAGAIEKTEVQLPNKEQAETELDTGLTLNISQFLIADESKIKISQRKETHNISTVISIDKVLLANLEPTNADSKSEFDVQARLGKFSTIQVSGEGQLFAEQPTITAKGELDAISLSEISPYIEPFVGYQFTSGQFDHVFQLSLKNNVIDMSNELLIRKVKIKDIDGNEQVTTLPLPMAIEMLEDGDGNIDLSIPVKGDLNNAEVGLSSIIQKSLSKALQKGSVSFLKYALQPYGAIVMAAEYAVDSANHIEFEPMIFEANSAVIDAQQQPYATKLADLLSNKKDLTITFCGVSNERDKQQILMDPSLSEEQVKFAVGDLAKQRSQALKSFFVKKQINPKRLFLCKYSYLKDGIGGVNISM
ncbi:DUF748 domain-containing protein [Thalassotalea fonticola]|uniref:DUF748 domain-containing protein n=1 Tax=Thalassotalea fonticola TaxID=3065649 RepID=A0ABZ0GP88_9GAMM|nr:DUF748 domain-containing protein [Colwelliaceae bacterium S1-1]